MAHSQPLSCRHVGCESFQCLRGGVDGFRVPCVKSTGRVPPAGWSKNRVPLWTPPPHCGSCRQGPWAPLRGLLRPLQGQPRPPRALPPWVWPQLPGSQRIKGIMRPRGAGSAPRRSTHSEYCPLAPTVSSGPCLERGRQPPTAKSGQVYMALLPWGPGGSLLRYVSWEQVVAVLRSGGSEGASEGNPFMC